MDASAGRAQCQTRLPTSEADICQDGVKAAALRRGEDEEGVSMQRCSRASGSRRTAAVSRSLTAFTSGLTARHLDTDNEATPYDA